MSEGVAVNECLRKEKVALESHQHRWSSERNKMQGQLQKLTCQSAGRFMTPCSSGGKVHCFYFAFTGPTFRYGVMADKIEELHYGQLEGDVNYAMMRMFSLNGRCEGHLIHIVDEYNRSVEHHHQITLHAVEDGNDGFFPLFIPKDSRTNNPIARKHAADLLGSDSSFVVRSCRSG